MVENSQGRGERKRNRDPTSACVCTVAAERDRETPPSRVCVCTVAAARQRPSQHVCMHSSSPPDGTGEMLIVLACPQAHLPLLGREDRLSEQERVVSLFARPATHGHSQTMCPMLEPQTLPSMPTDASLFLWHLGNSEAPDRGWGLWVSAPHGLWPHPQSGECHSLSTQDNEELASAT